MSAAPAPVTEAIPGDPTQVHAISRILHAVAHTATSDSTTIHHHRRQLDQHWRSGAAELAQLALADTASQLSNMEPRLREVASLLQRHAHEMTTLQSEYADTAKAIENLNARLATSPGDATLTHELQQAEGRLRTIAEHAHQAAASTAHAVEHLTPGTLPVMSRSHLSAVDALVLDGAVAGHTLSARNARHAAARWSTLSAKDRGALTGVLNHATSGKQVGSIFGMVAAGKSASAIRQVESTAKYFNINGPGEKLSGTSSWFNDTTTASGISAATHAGIALRQSSTMGGYWLVEFNGKKLILQQIDWGPAAWTGRTVDMSQPAMQAFGADPTNRTVTLRYLGKSVPPNLITR